MRLIDADHLRTRVSGWTPYSQAEYGARYEFGVMIDHEPTVGDWISVKDRLPKTGTLALVFGSAGAMTIARYIAVNEWLVPGIFSAVTHWIPLPEPPKEVTGDDH